jgi:hypothetical protein
MAVCLHFRAWWSLESFHPASPWTRAKSKGDQTVQFGEKSWGSSHSLPYSTEEDVLLWDLYSSEAKRQLGRHRQAVWETLWWQKCGFFGGAHWSKKLKDCLRISKRKRSS